MDPAVYNDLAIRARTEEQAFTELYNAFLDEIYGFVMKRIGHRETCEDIVSDVFRKVFTNLNAFDPQKASFRVWLYRITTNTMTDHYRVNRNPNKGHIVDIEEALDVHDTKPNPHEIALDNEQKQLMQEHINKLPPKYQTIIQMKYFDDMPHEEIAAIMNIKANNVGVLTHRAVKKLEKLLHTTSNAL